MSRTIHRAAAATAGTKRRHAIARRRGSGASVYAIVTGGTPRRVVDTRHGGRLRVVGAGPVDVLVRPASSTPSPTPAHLRCYDRTMQELAAAFDPLLPARFGTYVTSDAELLALLRGRERSLARALAALRGRTQMTVRVPGAGRQDGGDGESPRATDAAAVSGREYLRQRARTDAARRGVAGFTPVRRAVDRWVRNERVEHHGTVATIYHLIPRAAVDRYRRALQRSAAAAGLQVIVSGPWPPYAFVGDSQ